MANWWALSNSQGATVKWDFVESQNAPAQTTAWPNAAIGPFPTEAAAKAAINSATPSTIGGLGATGTGLSAAASEAAKIPPFTGIAAIGDFFGRLTEGNTWLRIGEGLLGIILIAVALGKLSGLEDTAKTAAAAAVKYVK